MKVEDGAELNSLADRYYREDGTRKPISYLAEYERLLGEVRNTPLRILELGVSSGASLLIWNDYLPNATIVGVDIGEMPECLAGHARIHFLRASQDDTAALDIAGQIGGPFDLIVDDASHIGFLTKRSFCHLFPRWLKPGGHYVIEDFGTAFLPEYPDGHAFRDPPADDAVENTAIFASHQYGMAGVVKQLMDHMMRELMVGTPSHIDIERLTILTNVAFVQKSARRNRVPPPVVLPSKQTSGSVPNSTPANPVEAPANPATTATVATTLPAANVRLGEDLAAVRPLQWLRRLLHGRPTP